MQQKDSTNITKSAYHSGCFEGNACFKVMNNVGKLEDLVKYEDEDMMPFVDVIWKTKLLDEILNITDLEDEFEEVIEAFSESYKVIHDNFQVSETNKVHIIASHISDYLKSTKTTLRKTKDQTTDCTHSKLDRFLKDHQYFRKNIDSINAGKKLFEGIKA